MSLKCAIQKQASEKIADFYKDLETYPRTTNKCNVTWQQVQFWDIWSSLCRHVVLAKHLFILEQRWLKSFLIRSRIPHFFFPCGLLVKCLCSISSSLMSRIQWDYVQANIQHMQILLSSHSLPFANDESATTGTYAATPSDGGINLWGDRAYSSIY